jgi:hypothetical protein
MSLIGDIAKAIPENEAIVLYHADFTSFDGIR